jgi:hypothetical protein
VTRTQAAGVMFVALGLIYALLYAAWLRKQRRHTSAAVAVEGGDAPARGPEGSAVVAEGTYISTTSAESRLERVAVAGLGNRAKATLTVRRGAPDELIRYDRQGESGVVIPAARLLHVRRDRGMAGKFVGANRLLVVQWRADDGSIYETSFLPRYKADLERLESALWWHTGTGGSNAQPGDRATPASSTTGEEDPTP